MYKGLARLVGMDVVGQATSLDEQMEELARQWNNYDFFFIHFKYTDSTGEDGNFDAKVKRTEELDACVPKIMQLGPSVFVCTGDHSTPAMLASHSWHPVPTLLWAKNCRTDRCESFGEAECLKGGLGQFEAKYLMTLALANAGRLQKYGA
jgi:2,3-bisphosphoglycerate-independent phosphoglycerate mutase